MNVTFRCPACHATARTAFSSESTELVCHHCSQTITVPDDAVTDNHVDRCLVCPGTDLFARKDFPQRLGVALVVLGIIGSSIAWAYYQLFWTFAILFLTALVDLALYMLMGESLTCYRCQAEYRGVHEVERHGGFDLETHERYRQMAARMTDRTASGASARPTGATAGE